MYDERPTPVAGLFCLRHLLLLVAATIAGASLSLVPSARENSAVVSAKIAAATISAIGNTSVGRSSGNFSADRKRVNRYALQAAASINKLSIYLQPTSTTGQQPIEGIVYADSNGSPGRLLATTEQLIFHHTDAAGWYDLPLASPLSVAPGSYWIGAITGTSGSVAGFGYTSVSGSRLYNRNTYTSGPSSPFGSASVDSERMSLYAAYTPQPPSSPPPPTTTTTATTPPPTNTAAPTISGTPLVGQKLTAGLGTWSGSPTGYSFTWERSGSSGGWAPISGATGSSYTVQTADVGSTLEVLITASNAAGSSSPVASAATAAAAECDLLASPTGSDSNGNGGLASPYQSLAKLDASLAPGQTGCLRAGTFGDTSTWHQINASGTASGQITITSYPGETPTVVGYVDIEGSYTTLSHLQVDGSNTLYASHPSGINCPGNVSEPLVIAGRDDTLEYDNYFQSVSSLRGNAIGIGFWGDADNTIIRYDKIHDVGQCLQYDHLIYLSHGDNVQIYDNWMYNDQHGNGVTIYPGPTNARIFDNVIDAAGTGFAFGDDGGSTAGNQVFHNVISNSTGIAGDGSDLAPVMARSPGLSATSLGNQVYENDSFNNSGGQTQIASGVSASQLSVTNNITSDPQFVAANHNYNVQSGSPVAGWGLWNGS